jgi:hypothetical protein
MHNDDTNILVEIAYLDAGLIPRCGSFTSKDGKLLFCMLENMTTNEARTSKRKFRKYFRKALAAEKEKIALGVENEFKWRSRRHRRQMQAHRIKRLELANGVGCGETAALLNYHKANRRQLVYRYIYSTQ